MTLNINIIELLFLTFIQFKYESNSKLSSLLIKQETATAYIPSDIQYFWQTRWTIAIKFKEKQTIEKPLVKYAKLFGIQLTFNTEIYSFESVCCL